MIQMENKLNETKFQFWRHRVRKSLNADKYGELRTLFILSDLIKPEKAQLKYTKALASLFNSEFINGPNEYGYLYLPEHSPKYLTREQIEELVNNMKEEAGERKNSK